MFPRLKRARRLLIVGALLWNVPAWACSVPVFRYALEHWAADPFQAVVFHRGPLSEAQQAATRELSADGLTDALRANVSVQTVDLDQNPAPELLALWQGAKTESLPSVVLKYPASARRPDPFWSGPLSAESVAQLFDSPARQAIVQRLSDGQSAVWLLLDSGDAAKDDAAAELLKTRLSYLASVLQLPKLDAQDIANGLVSVGDGGLRLEFSTLRISRNDAREQVFVRMLLGAESGLAEAGAPIVFPIFGQGRALYALVGDGIKRETIDRAAMFLIGKCSCQVKEQNPGIDLLVAADWKGLIKVSSAALPDLPTIAELQNAGPDTVVFSGKNDVVGQPGDPNQRRSRSTLFLMAGIGAVAAALVATRLLRRR